MQEKTVEIVANLVSRKPKLDTQEEHPAVAPEIIALEY